MLGYNTWVASMLGSMMRIYDYQFLPRAMGMV
jgi:hypothetical protein